MILNGYLVKVIDREVKDNNGNPRVIYHAYILDSDDEGGANPVKVSLDNYETAKSLRARERGEVSIVCACNLWSYESKRGVTFKFVRTL